MGGEDALFSQALRAINSWPGITVAAASGIFRTEPQGDREQPWFCNQAAALDCSGRITPQGLLKDLLSLEIHLGRDRDANRRFGPRRIDLDLLLFGDILNTDPFVLLPHPRMRERAFVLVPLLEIAPGLIFPDGVPVARVLAGLTYTVDNGIIRQP